MFGFCSNLRICVKFILTPIILFSISLSLILHFLQQIGTARILKRLGFNNSTFYFLCSSQCRNITAFITIQIKYMFSKVLSCVLFLGTLGRGCYVLVQFHYYPNYGTFVVGIDTPCRKSSWIHWSRNAKTLNRSSVSFLRAILRHEGSVLAWRLFFFICWFTYTWHKT